MSTYKRHTRVCTFEELKPTLKQALRAYFLKLELTDMETQIIMCCETLSERQKTNALEALLGENGDPVYYLAAFVTPDWLVWARGSESTKTTVVAAKLRSIHVKPRASVSSNDTSLDIDGFVEGSFSKVRGHLALGPEPEAEEFCKAAQQANVAVNPPRRLLDIFGKTPGQG
jgi:hypothetical protein